MKPPPAPPARERVNRGGGKGGMNQFGLLDMGGMMDFDPSNLDDMLDDDDDDEGLEAELLAITSGQPTKAKRRQKGVRAGDLDAMVAASMKDIPSDEEDDMSDLEADEALLAELQQLTPDGDETEEAETPDEAPTFRRPAPAPPTDVTQPSLPADGPEHSLKRPAPASDSSSMVVLLEERINVYKLAIANAKSANDSSKVRRFERGHKTLETMLKSAKAGKPVNEDDIPPMVATGGAAVTTPSSSLTPAPPSVQQPDTVTQSLQPPLIPLPLQPTLQLPPSQQPPALPPRPQQLHPTTMTTSAFSERAPEESIIHPMSLLPSAPPFEPPLSPTLSAPKASHEQLTPESVSTPRTLQDNASSDDDQNVMSLLTTRRDQYKQAALAAKHVGDKAAAVDHIKTVKKFEAVIKALEQGQPVDLSLMPPPPPGYSGGGSLPASSTVPKPVPAPRTAISQAQGSAPVESKVETQTDEMPEGDPDPSLYNAPPAPSSVLEALQQRRDKYMATQKEAAEQENTSKSRRMGRIVKQYDDAIKLCKAGKPIPFDELPDPPGFAPIPREGAGHSQAAVQPKPMPRPAPPAAAHAGTTPGPTSSEGGAPPPLPPRQPSGAAPVAGNTSQSVVAPRSIAPAGAAKPGAQAGLAKPGAAKQAVPAAQTRQDKQMQMLQKRQQLFREAAIEAKKRGDIAAAKEYLRLSKGFDQMIEATKCGLPVNIESAPVPPQMARDDSFEVVEHEDCLPPGDRGEMYERLENDLKAQVEMCIKNRDHFAQLGDITNSNKFQQLAEHTKKDLSSIKYAFKRGDEVPRFHYEMRTFSIVKCFTDLTDNDLDLMVVRGLNYSCQNPKEIDTYVKYEFPFPPESPPSGRTHTIKDTNNPDYNQNFILPINRKNRALGRTFKRGAIKLEVMAKSGFFRSSVVLGTVTVKLAALENKCLIHECFDLMEGRKPVGGKLEVKVRLRDPLLAKQVEQIKEKWLVIDQFK